MTRCARLAVAALTLITCLVLVAGCGDDDDSSGAATVDCAVSADGVACEWDGNACTSDTCQGGACTSTDARTCTGAERCNPHTGRCEIFAGAISCSLPPYDCPDGCYCGGGYCQDIVVGDRHCYPTGGEGNPLCDGSQASCPPGWTYCAEGICYR